MAIMLECGACQSKFSLKEEFAGKKVRCPRCQNVLEVPELELDLAVVAGTGTENDAAGGLHPHFQCDKYLVKQKLFRLNENYDIMNDQKEKLFYATRPVFFLATCGVVLLGFFVFILILVAGAFLGDAVGKAAMPFVVLFFFLLGFLVLIAIGVWLLPKRHVYIYENDSKENLLLEVKQDQKVQLVSATFTIIDPHVGVIANLKKNYLMNIIRRSWRIFDNDGNLIANVKEDSIILSLLRRLLGPMFGLLRTNFIFEYPDSEKIFGEYNRKMTLFDQYVMDLSKDKQRKFDRRIAVGMCVMLDSGERR